MTNLERKGRRVAFVLAENAAGKVLLIQRAYGSRKYKWSLPGGYCDKDSYERAAVREAREETGLRVELVSTILIGRRHRIKTFFAKITGGRLRAQRRECRDAQFFPYDALPPLAFSMDRRSIDSWLAMKEAHSEALAIASPPCTHCGSSRTRLRRAPHHNLYRCRHCGKTFGSTTSN